MKKRKSRILLLILGLALLIAGLAGLAAGPRLVQFAFLPKTEKTQELLEGLDKAREELADPFPLLTLHGQKNGVTLTVNQISQNDICLYLTGPSWNEVYPRRFLKGRPVSPVEAEQAAKVIVLDEETAFLFFGDRDPLGKTVTLGDQMLEVIGVAEHTRRMGETGAHAAWTPLGTVPDCDLMVLSASVSGNSSLLAVFRSAAVSAVGEGTLISLPKEGARATMLLRVVGLILALWALAKALRLLGVFSRRQMDSVREESRKRYAGRLIPFALIRLAPVALLTALAIAAGFGLALLAAEPARIFPEWVPESLGDVSAWVTRFWSISGSFAEPVSLKTPELTELRFWAALVRWGIVLTLLGVLRRKSGRTRPDPEGQD